MTSAVDMAQSTVPLRKDHVKDQDRRNRAWKKLCSSRVMDVGSEENRASIDILVEHGKLGLLAALLLERCQKMVRTTIAPEFWNFFHSYNAVKASRSPREVNSWIDDQVRSAFGYLTDAFGSIRSALEAVDDHYANRDTRVSETIVEHFHAIVFNRKIPEFGEILTAFFRHCFQRHYREWKRAHGAQDDFMPEEEAEHGREEEEEEEEEVSSEGFDETQRFGHQLYELRLFGMVEEAFAETMYREIQSKLSLVCVGNYEVPLLANFHRWMHSAVFSWLEKLLESSPPQYVQQWQTRLEFHLFEAYGTLRIKELFDIIKEFPESLAALNDLKQCLERTLQHEQLIECVSRAFVCRLLQPGPRTSQVIDIYILTIKALRTLDPAGILLERLGEPIKEYLRQRRDTVRCIVTSLTDDSQSELYEELGRGDLHLIQHHDWSEDEDEAMEGWQPDPIEADPSKTSQSRLSEDLLSMLVSIYGSKEVFVTEYRLMLADKLLRLDDFDTEQDITTLERLKLRFGDASLESCEIMIKDMDDSKRTSANISSSRRTLTTTTTAAMVSHQFWPTLQHTEFDLHPTLERLASAFRREYASLKKPRSLKWLASLGFVTLTLTIKSVSKEFIVSPLHATLVCYFEAEEEKSEAENTRRSPRLSWTASELASEIDVENLDLVVKTLRFWLQHDVLVLDATSRRYHVVEHLTQHHDVGSSFESFEGLDDDLDEAPRAVSSDVQRAEELRVFETYIVGILSNYGQLGIGRIHAMLRTFARSGSEVYDKTIPELAGMLDQLVKRHKIECLAGEYSMVR